MLKGNISFNLQAEKFGDSFVMEAMISDKVKTDITQAVCIKVYYAYFTVLIQELIDFALV